MFSGLRVLHSVKWVAKVLIFRERCWGKASLNSSIELLLYKSMSNKSHLSHHEQQFLLLSWLLSSISLIFWMLTFSLTWDKPPCYFTCYFAVLYIILFIDTIQVVANKSVSYAKERGSFAFFFFIKSAY